MTNGQATPDMGGTSNERKQNKQVNGKKRIGRNLRQLQIDNLPEKGRDDAVSKKKEPENFQNAENKENCCKVNM